MILGRRAVPDEMAPHRAVGCCDGGADLGNLAVTFESMPK